MPMEIQENKATVQTHCQIIAQPPKEEASNDDIDFILKHTIYYNEDGIRKYISKGSKTYLLEKSNK